MQPWPQCPLSMLAPRQSLLDRHGMRGWGWLAGPRDHSQARFHRTQWGVQKLVSLWSSVVLYPLFFWDELNYLKYGKGLRSDQIPEFAEQSENSSSAVCVRVVILRMLQASEMFAMWTEVSIYLSREISRVMEKSMEKLSANVKIKVTARN